MNLVIEDVPEPDDIAVIERALDDHATLGGVAPRNQQRLGVFVRDDHSVIVGGLVGATAWNWLHVGLLWVADGYRGAGLGSRLLRAGEDVAFRRGCGDAHLETFNAEALPFYDRHGYVVFGTLPDCPKGRTKYFLKKALVEGQ